MQMGIGMAGHRFGAAAAARPSAAGPGEVVAGGHATTDQMRVDHVRIGAPKIRIGMALRRVLYRAG